MNRIELLSWLYGPDADCQEGATNCFNRLRRGIEQGKKFPFDCPHQVTLIHNLVGSEWLVAILVMLGTQGDDSVEQHNRLKEWIESCGSIMGQDRRGCPVYGGTVQSSLNIKYNSPKWDYLDSFGTIQEKVTTKPKSDTPSAIQEETKKRGWWQFWR